MQHIADLIRERRQNLGMTQAELAELSGWSERTVRRIEQGDMGVTVQALTDITAALDCAINLTDRPDLADSCMDIHPEGV